MSTGTSHDEARRVFAEAPFIADLGARLESLGPGTCESSLEIAPRHLQQDGFVHAGVQATLADHTAGAAGATLVGKGQIVLTIEFKINLLRPASGERLLCRSRVLRPGRQVSVVESEVLARAGDRETLVSKATVTLAVVAARRAGEAPGP
jgi:uncharacterized protein (TIGR00369 family)